MVIPRCSVATIVRGYAFISGGPKKTSEQSLTHQSPCQLNLLLLLLRGLSSRREAKGGARAAFLTVLRSDAPLPSRTVLDYFCNGLYIFRVCLPNISHSYTACPPYIAVVVPGHTIYTSQSSGSIQQLNQSAQTFHRNIRV